MPIPAAAMPLHAVNRFSHDYRIRLGVHQLDSLALEHLYSEPDPSVLGDAMAFYGPGFAGAHAGLTEWSATTQGGAVLSLGWDWVAHNDGQIVALRAVGPRTNLVVLDPAGYDLVESENLQHVWRIIGELPWQLAVKNELKSLAF